MGKGCKSEQSAQKCSRYNLGLSLSHDTIWANTAEECCAQTLSDARLSATMMWRRVLFMSEQHKHRSRGRSLWATNASLLFIYIEASPGWRHAVDASGYRASRRFCGRIGLDVWLARTVGTGRSSNLEL